MKETINIQNIQQSELIYSVLTKNTTDKQAHFQCSCFYFPLLYFFFVYNLKQVECIWQTVNVNFMHVPDVKCQ